MASPVPNAFSPIRFAVLPEHCEAVLRQLGCAPPQWEEIATLVMRDPGLLHDLLVAAPLARQRIGGALQDMLVARLRQLGADLLRAWLAQRMWDQSFASARARATIADSILVAECAFHLARQTGYRFPDEAYLTGLWHRLSGLRTPSAGEQRRHTEEAEATAHPFDEGGFDDHATTRAPAPSAALTARLVAMCEAPDPMLDALALEQALEEQLLVAHPLVRLLWSARTLAHEQWRSQAEQLARVTALGVDELYSLRTDACFLAQQYSGTPNADTSLPADYTPRSPAVTPSASAMPPSIHSPDPLRMAATVGLIHGGFARLDETQVRERFAVGCRLLCGTGAPLIVVADDSGALRPLAFAGIAAVNDCYAELDPRLDDETSVIALALRTGTATSQLGDGAQPGRSFHDWHVARWLHQPGLLCLPLNLEGHRAVAVMGVAAGALPEAATREVLTALSAAATLTVLEAERQRALQASLAGDIAERYRDQARRIAHETKNPLTVIRSYLGLITQGRPQDQALDKEMRILHAELDRLGRLIQQGTETPVATPEPNHCAVAQVLDDMRTLYGEALFGSRGIQFEVRANAGLPPVAMPASAMKQVLLNLFRNASEELQPGGRFSVSLPGQLVSNGVPCIEIRLIDNGPGLPPERLADLFAARPSRKGGEHQGLGLSIVNDVLRQWHGYILCRSQPGTGTSFQLLVPLANTG